MDGHHHYSRYDSFDNDEQQGYVFPPPPPPHAANNDNKRMNPGFSGSRRGRSGYQHRGSHHPKPPVGYMPPRYPSSSSQHLPHQPGLPADMAGNRLSNNPKYPPHSQRPFYYQDYDDSTSQHYFQQETDSFYNPAFASNECNFRGNYSRPFSVS